ncbi:alpha/beta fold hydrolase [Corynebacterium doosanense]|uniref:alpha/beta fold hydrolase n=1 Tax=Corynebacterium doosanense TaxID=1121358 RepID=UPI00036E8B74|nr:alpha/beta hydrolase [Corynebacterium doosanense]
MRPHLPLQRIREAPGEIGNYAQRALALGRKNHLSRSRTRHLAQARKGFSTSRGSVIAWYEYGPVDAETTVVFVHGFTLASESFYLQVEYMMAEWPDVRLLLVDLRGHGRSEHVPIEACTIDSAADDVLAVIDERAMTGRLVLLGHSLGGPVSLAVVRRMREDVIDRLAGLVEVSTTVEPMAGAGLATILDTRFVTGMATLFSRHPDRARPLRQSVNGLLAPILSMAFFMRETDKDLIDFHAALIAETPTETLIGFLDDLQYHEEVGAASRLAGVPGFVIVGEKDYVIPSAQSEKLLELWPDAKFQVAQNAGHMLPLEVPGIINSALDRLLKTLG